MPLGRFLVPLAGSAIPLGLAGALLMVASAGAAPPAPPPSQTRDPLFTSNPTVAQRPAQDRQQAVAAIRAFAQNGALTPTYARTTKLAYNATKLAEVYYAGLDEYLVDPATNTIVQFGPRPRNSGEAAGPVDTTARFTRAELEQRARAFIAERVPSADLARLTLTVSAKRGSVPTGKEGAKPAPAATDQPTAFFFRWEDRQAQAPDPRVIAARPFVQVGFSVGGDVLSYTNTLTFSR